MDEYFLMQRFLSQLTKEKPAIVIKRKFFEAAARYYSENNQLAEIVDLKKQGKIDSLMYLCLTSGINELEGWDKYRERLEEDFNVQIIQNLMNGDYEVCKRGRHYENQDRIFLP